LLDSLKTLLDSSLIPSELKRDVLDLAADSVLFLFSIFNKEKFFGKLAKLFYSNSIFSLSTGHSMNPSEVSLFKIVTKHSSHRVCLH
jgi:hypothetical protein